VLSIETGFNPFQKKRFKKICHFSHQVKPVAIDAARNIPGVINRNGL